MTNSKLPFFLIVTIAFLCSCNSADKKSKAGYQASFVTGSTNNKIEILDFGGTGQPILFLTGLGNSAHVYIEFAPKFTDKFHVYAMTRRGFGTSEQTANGYHIDTLAKDILSVISALKLDKPVLIGHSIAGDEISKFASSYPGKVDKIVYLDAAYDRMDLMSGLMAQMPAFPSPTTKDSSSLENMQAFSAKNFGIRMPDEEVKNTSVFSKEGKYEKDVTSGEIQGKIIAGIEHPDYKDIICPALAIYATSSSVHTIFAFYDSLDAANKMKADTSFVLFGKWSNAEIARFKKEVQHATVKEINGANHYVFISHPAETENMIREFLK